MTDIFNEIKEDIRRERLKKLWDRFGLYLIALVVVIVVGVGGWRLWVWYSQQQSAATGAQFEAALQLARDGNADQAMTALDKIATSGAGGYRLLARFRVAVAKAHEDPAAGAKALEAIAADDGVPPRIRHLATLRAGMVLLGTKDFAGVKAQVQQLAAPGKPWRNSAREILALEAWHNGDAATTQKLAQEMVSDASSPPGTRQRASLLLALADSALAAKSTQASAQATPGAEAAASAAPAAPPAASPSSTTSPATKPTSE
jgi:hypothetical protein